MAYMTLTEKARVWSSLDDNLRNKIRSGEITLEEASSYVVPIGDNELATARAQYPTRPQSTEPAAPQGEWGIGTMVDTNIGRIKQSGAAIQATDAALEMEQAERTQQAQDTGMIGTLTNRIRERLPAAAQAVQDPNILLPGNLMAAGSNALSATAQAVSEAFNDEAQAAVTTREESAAAIQIARDRLGGHIQKLNEGTAYLNSLPQNPYAKAAVESANNGDWLNWWMNIGPAAASTMGEQGIELMASGAIVAATAYGTRNPAATAAAARAASLVTSSSEYGSDLAGLWDEVPEAERTFEKFQEVRKIAAQAAAGRSLIEAALPGAGAKLGSTAYRRAAIELGLQMGSGAMGEDLATRIKSGDGASLLERATSGEGASAGELLLEAAADSAGVVFEAGGALRNARLDDTQDLYAQRRILEAQQQFADDKVMELRAGTNREKFDADVAAERALADLQDDAFQNGIQTEMPIGSGDGGGTSRGVFEGTPELGDNPNPARRIAGTDREPTIVDMFSGQERSAAAAASDVANRVPADQMPEETDEAFEIRKQRELKARNQIDRRKQEDFETTKANELQARTGQENLEQDTFEQEQAKAESERNQLAEDQTTLKNERQLLSTTDITREAKDLLTREQEGIRRARRGIVRSPKQMEAMLKAYERKRLPDLIESVRKRRLETVTAARKRDIDRENAKLKKEQEAKKAAKAAADFTTAPRKRTDIPARLPTSPEGSARGGMTDLLPGNQRKVAQTYRGKVLDAEYQADEAFEVESQRRSDASPARGTQGQLELPAQDDQSDLFGLGNRGAEAMTDEQRAEELARGQARRRTLTEKMADKSAKEKEATAKEIESEIPTVAKALEQARTKQATAAVDKYKREETKAVNEIIKDELSKSEGKTEAEVQQSTAARVAAWKKANPAPAAAPAPATDLQAVAEDIQKKQATAAKQAEGRNIRNELKRALARGATPDEAAEQVSNRRLTKEEDADVRKDLGGKPAARKAEPSMVRRYDGVITWNESADLRSVYQALINGNRPDKMGQLLKAVGDSPDATEGQKWLANRLAPLVSNLGIKLTDNAPEGSMTWLGTFQPELNEVWLKSTDPVTILHEALHAVTSNLLLSPVARQNPAVKKAARELEDVMELARADIRDGGLFRMTPELAAMMSAEAGPISNIREFLAYGLTDRDMVAWLSSIPVPGEKRNTWQKFKAAMSSLFKPRNAEQRNALDAIIDATNDLVEAQEKDPGLNAQATSNLRRMAGMMRPDPQTAPRLDFSNPTTKRDYFDVALTGKVNAKIKKEWASQPITSLLDALTNGAAGRSVTTEVFDRAQSDTAAMIQRGEQLYNAIDYSLDASAAEQGINPDTYRKKFLEEVKAFEQETDRSKKAEMAKSIRKDYKLAGRSYFQMRRTIDNLSRDILRQRLEDPRPFTKEEAKIYRSIRDNIGTYYSRVYAHHTQGVAKTRARSLLKAYKKVVGGSTDPEQVAEYKIVRDAAIYVREHMLAIPDQDTLESMPYSKLRQLGEAWGISPVGEADLDNVPDLEARRTQLIEQLDAFAQKSPEAKDQRAMILIEDMLLGKQNSPLTSYFRGSKQDRTIVTERVQVPEEIRKLLGEFEDTPLRGMITIARQAEFRARNKAFNELLTAERGDRIMSDDEFSASGRSPQDWTQLSGAAYGALEDMWVRNDLAARIEDSAEVAATFDQALAKAEQDPLAAPAYIARKAFEKWSKLAGLLKSIQLVWNMGNMAFNFMGGPLITMSNGNFSPKQIKRAMKTASDLILATRQGGNLTGDMQKVVRAGITDSAFMGEIRAVELDQLRQAAVEGMRNPFQKKANALEQGRKTLSRAWRETYAMADVVWKIANFYAEEAKLEEFYKAEGVKRTPEQIEREAAWNTNVSNFSYKRVPNLFKITEKSGLTFIMPYIYETFRAPIGSLVVANRDRKKAQAATTPEGKAIMMKSAAKRAMGAALSMGAMQSIMYFMARQAAEALGMSDEEEQEWVEKLKALLPDYKANAEYMYAGQKDGKPVLFEMSRLDPMGPATEFYKAMLTMDENTDILEEASRLFIGNPYGITILQAMINQDTASEDKLAKAMTPSWLYRAMDQNNEAPDDDILLRFMTNMGVSITQVDAAKSVQYKANDFKTTRNELRTELYDFLKRARDLEPNEILSEFSDLQQKEADAFEDLSALYDGMQDLGYTSEQALGMLRSEKLTLGDLGALAQGYQPENAGVISMSGLETSYNALVADGNATAEDKERYLANIHKVLELAQQGELPIRE